jgi:Protein of unknown function (DUF1549)/Protein of unknown function (DUF1553)
MSDSCKPCQQRTTVANSRHGKPSSQRAFWNFVSQCYRARMIRGYGLRLVAAQCVGAWFAASLHAEHWAYRPLVRPAVPAIQAVSRDCNNPIDAFIDERLRSSGKMAAGEADRRTLLRRVTFDLCGLPPTQDDISMFTSDPDPAAYERVVDRLLASSGLGERWARLWMDAVHFAETHGHDQDRIREHAWPYRDYLIGSFNDDKPYARFVSEQVAGDALYPDDPQATVALGFLAAGPWDESSLRDIREDTLDRQIARYLDRDDMIATTLQTFCSVTVQCARCHDHKFDPIPQRDYYALQAVFAGVDRANRAFDTDPAVRRERERLTAESAIDRAVSWKVLEPRSWGTESGSVLARQADGSLLASGPLPECDVYSIEVEVPAGASALRLEVLAHDSLRQRGPGRAENGNFHLSEFVVQTKDGVVPMRGAAADFNQAGWTVDHALDNDEKTAWGIDPQEGKDHWAVFASPALRAGAATILLKQLHGRNHLIGRLRLSACVGPPPAAVQLASLPPPQLVYAAATDFVPEGGLVPMHGVPREIHLLVRGEITNPAQLIHSPGALTCCHAPFEAGDFAREENRRAALARWLVDPKQPLTWRSIVNRIWHWHFGVGLVDTPNDFGKMGSEPSHPQLLDWLACWFRDDAHGSMKALHRLIVTSAAYRRAAARSAAADAADYVYRFPRRLDAEEIHDAILQISGDLDGRMGGPSDRQFDLKPGVHVTPIVDYAAVDFDGAAARRRSVYRFLFRTLPDPWMEALDCPAGDQLTPDRKNTVTVQQALALWNGAFAIHQAERLARRLVSLSADAREQSRAACERILGRSPAGPEAAEWPGYVERHGLANLCRVLFNSNEFVFVP